jgi:hypothetical protein
VSLKLDRFVERRPDSEKCDNNINKKPVQAGPSQVRFLKIGVLLSQILVLYSNSSVPQK